VHALVDNFAHRGIRSLAVARADADGNWQMRGMG
jgi:hypothetical protein